MEPVISHQLGGTAAVVGGLLLSIACILRAIYEDDAVEGLTITGTIIVAVGILLALFGYMKDWMVNSSNRVDNVRLYTMKFAAALAFAGIVIWTTVRLTAYGESIPTPAGCGHTDNTKTTVDPAFMEIGVAGNSQVDILVAITMALTMISYYGPLISEDRDDATEKGLVHILYTVLCVASVSNIAWTSMASAYLGGPSPFDNQTTRFEAISRLRVTSMVLIAIQLLLAGALSLGSKKSKDGKDSFLEVGDSDEMRWVVHLHRFLQFMFASATFVGAIILAFSTGTYHSENKTVSIAKMACESPARFDQNATGSSLFAFLLPYLLSLWWDTTRIGRPKPEQP